MQSQLVLLFVQAPHYSTRFAALLAQLEHAESLSHASSLNDSGALQAFFARGAASPTLAGALVVLALIYGQRSEDALSTACTLAQAAFVNALCVRSAIHLFSLRCRLWFLLPATEEAESCTTLSQRHLLDDGGFLGLDPVQGACNVPPLLTSLEFFVPLREDPICASGK
ncbi:hypothetical protein TOPH_01195 [Tolypocladium ophioglossoides CBS 100239]|uniref:Uncharacterized protein n=1 Tax=Tolypocladium ophioglossoides (strain CBS 100239) TaxID=1163406 RepID=A0A0L0NK10_TOLOC|nr:hypothetical protein TOPH_01195 [Tolypocladium ophioglossoides CBS 100239]